MKSTSARYLLPFLIAAGLPVACSGSTSADTFSPTTPAGGEGGSPDSAEPGDTAGKSSGAGMAGKSGKPSGDGGASEGGATAVAGTGGQNQAGKGPMGGTGGMGGIGEAGSAGRGEAGSAGSGEAGAGGEGTGVELGGPLLDPKADGAPDASSGHYRLRHHATQKCLGLGDAPSVGACDNAAVHSFYLDGAAGGGKVFVRNANGQCVAIAGTVVESHSCVADAALALVPVGGGFFQLKNDAGLCLDVSDGAAAAGPCNDANKWSLDHVGTNFALAATYSATSTFPGYSVNYIHDGIRDTGLEGVSWANDWDPPALYFPQDVNVDFGKLRQISSIDLLSSAGYIIGSYDINYWDGKAWIQLEAVTGNVQLDTVHVFNTVVTSKLKITVRRGPENQFNFARINELEIY